MKNPLIELFENFNYRLSCLERAYQSPLDKSEKYYQEEAKELIDSLNSEFKAVFERLGISEETFSNMSNEYLASLCNVDDSSPSMAELIKLPYEEAAVYADGICKEAKATDPIIIEAIEEINLKAEYSVLREQLGFDNWNRTSYANMCWLYTQIEIGDTTAIKLKFILEDFQTYMTKKLETLN